jgi:hypothetical protein
MVRMKLDDRRMIEKLDSSIKIIYNKYSLNKKATDLANLAEDCQFKLKDPEFLNDV